MENKQPPIKEILWVRNNKIETMDINNHNGIYKSNCED